nr:glycosyltransferase family 87 protein [Corynebacterium lactis]
MSKHRLVKESGWSALLKAPQHPDAHGTPSASRGQDGTNVAPVMSWQLILLALVTGGIISWIWQGRTQPDDWASLWIAGDLVEKGQAAHLYDHHPEDFAAMAGQQWLDAAREVSAPFPHPFVQNPLIAYILAPLTESMTFDTSVMWLLFFSGAALVVLTASAYNLWFRRTLPWGIAAAAVAAISLLPTTINSLWLGQTTPLIVAGVSYGLAASRSRPWLAGIVLGIVAMVKLTPIVLIVVMLFFALRRSAGLWGVATTAVFAVSTWVFVENSVISTWFERLSDISSSVLVGPVNQSLASIIASQDVELKYAVTVMMDFPDQAKSLPLTLATVMTALAAAVAWWNRTYRFEILVVSGWGIATAFSAIVWTHYMLSLVPFVAGFMAMANSRYTRQWPYVGIAALLLLLGFPVTNPIAATPFTPGFQYSGITSLIGAGIFLILVGAFHAAGTNRGKSAEPMLLFDGVSRVVKRGWTAAKGSA